MRANIFILFLALLFVSCEHKDLCYMHPHDKEVRILFDWSHIHEQNIPRTVKVILFPVGGSAYMEFDLPSEGGIINAPSGDYEIVSFNSDSYVNHMEYEDFSGDNNLVVCSVKSKVFPGKYMSPDFLCWAKMADGWTDLEDNHLVRMIPERKVAKVTYDIRGIDGIDKAKTFYGVFSGCSVEVDLHEGICVERKIEGMRHDVVINMDYKDNALQGSFWLLGGGFTHTKRESDEHMHFLTIYWEKKDGKFGCTTVDITEQVPCGNELGTTMEDFHIELVLDINITDEDGNEDGMFEPDVEDWEDIEVDIPL